MIKPEQIDTIAERIGSMSEEKQEALIDDLAELQPALLSYAMSEEAEELGENEAEIILFATTVIWKVFNTNHKNKLEEISDEELDALQDNNWKALDDRERKSGQSLADFVEPFYEGYAEPEILTFIVDVLEEEEDSEDEFNINDTSRVPMFVMLKSVADALLKAIK